MLLIPVTVRRAAADRADDLAALVRLWPPLPGCVRPESGESLTTRVSTALRSPCVVIFIARSDLDVGFIVLSLGPLSPMLSEENICIEHLYVLPKARRLGVARTLVARATAFAEQRGVQRITTNVPAADRLAHRFFARLGFRPVFLRRAVSVAALRRRLVPQACPARDLTVLRRRSLRARSLSGPPKEIG